MKLVVFGHSISSAWANAQSAFWRGLSRALTDRGHRILFFERDLPYHPAHRDLAGLAGVDVRFYDEWEDALPSARRHLREADAGLVTSDCPDALEASEAVLSSSAPLRVFYELQTRSTLGKLREGLPVAHICPQGFRNFELILSAVGGRALSELHDRLGVSRVAALYNAVDPLVHRPTPLSPAYEAHMSYLGPYSEKIRESLVRLLVDPARRTGKPSLIGGAAYPADFPWTPSVRFVRHVALSRHSAFFSSAKLILQLSGAGGSYSPTNGLFQATACGAPVLSDWWEGIDSFYEPGVEILVAHNTEHALEALSLSDLELRRIAQAGRERTFACHTTERRASELEAILEAWRPTAVTAYAAGRGVAPERH